MLFFAISYVHVNFVMLMEAALYYNFVYIVAKNCYRLDRNIRDLMFSVVEHCYILKRLPLSELDCAFSSKDRESFNGLIDRHELCPLYDPLAGLKIGILTYGVDLT